MNIRKEVAARFHLGFNRPLKNQGAGCVLEKDPVPSISINLDSGGLTPDCLQKFISLRATIRCKNSNSGLVGEIRTVTTLLPV
jgi:hypothetical protein